MLFGTRLIVVMHTLLITLLISGFHVVVMGVHALLKMTGGTPEVRSDKSLTLMTFGPMDQRTNGIMDQWTNGPMDQWTNGPMDQ